MREPALSSGELRAEQLRSVSYLASVEALAYRDPLTGLLNRRNLPSLLREALDAAAARNRAVALLYFDVDNFNAINDRHGHAAGDTVLATVADRLASLFRASDLVARLGGDEFLAVLTDLDSGSADADAWAVAEQCLTISCTTIDLAGASITPVHQPRRQHLTPRR